MMVWGSIQEIRCRQGETGEPEVAQVDHLHNHTRWHLAERQRVVNTAWSFLDSANLLLNLWHVLVI